MDFGPLTKLQLIALQEYMNIEDSSIYHFHMSNQ